MLESQTNAMVSILKDKDLQAYTGDSFYNFIKAVMFHDAGALTDGVRDVKALLSHIPTASFWNKMERYLFGTFRCYADQVKLSEKFTKDNLSYYDFVKRQMYLIDKIDADQKVDYFANLTRCFLINDMEVALYYKLANFINICTAEELDYIRNYDYDRKSDINTIISSLYHYGLFEQSSREQGGADYVLSGFATALKRSALNYDDEPAGKNLALRYTQINPISIAEPATWSDIDEILNEVK